MAVPENAVGDAIFQGANKLVSPIIKTFYLKEYLK